MAEYTTIYRFQSEFARRHFARGEAEGKARGEADGSMKGEAEAVLEILEARGITVAADVRMRITGCTDLDQLRTWIRRAATAEKIQDLDG